MAVQITETKNIKLACCTNGPSICLRWLNKLGGWGIWVFQYNQTQTDETSRDSVSVNTSSAQLFNQYNKDLESADSTQEVTTINVQPKMTLGYTNLAKEDIIGIRGILHSTKVQMLMNPDSWKVDGPVWQTVIVEVGSFVLFETRKNFYELEFTILQPQLYTISQ